MNFFADFQRLGPLGKEDFLTSSLGALLSNVGSLRTAFLKWLQPHVHENLVGRAWRVERTTGFDAGEFGAAYPDLVFEADDLELWFEHKIGARQGEQASKSNPDERLKQLERYQRARALREESTNRRVLLFYVTADSRSLREDDLKPLHTAAGEGGYVWPGTLGHFRLS